MSKCCGCAELTSDADYDLALHVAAVVILFVVSAAGALLPVLVKHAGLSTIVPPFAIEWLMTFGFGVVISTGFIHMMNDGIEMLSDPCLGDVVESYSCLGMAIVLATVVAMHLIECESSVFFATQSSHHHQLHFHGHTHVAVSASGTNHHSEPTPEPDPYNDKLSTNDSLPLKDSDSSSSSQRKLAVVLFELGVVFHSVIVGVDLGVTAGTEFKTLLAAMCFHQFFEGIAVGGSALEALGSMRNVLGVTLAFALTTPLGLALGIAVHSSYSSTSLSALWVQGVLNCVAGGILLYTGLVELLTRHMTTNASFLARSDRERFLLYTACWLGAGAMAVIGKWA